MRRIAKYSYVKIYGPTVDEGELGSKWRASGGEEANGPAAAAMAGPGTVKPQGHTGLYCPYNAASVTP